MLGTFCLQESAEGRFLVNPPGGLVWSFNNQQWHGLRIRASIHKCYTSRMNSFLQYTVRINEQQQLGVGFLVFLFLFLFGQEQIRVLLLLHKPPFEGQNDRIIDCSHTKKINQLKIIIKQIAISRMCQHTFHQQVYAFCK